MMKFRRSDQQITYGEDKEIDFLTENEKEQEVPGNKGVLSHEIIKDGSSFMDAFIPALQKEERKVPEYPQYKVEFKPHEIYVRYENTLYDHSFRMGIIDVRCMKCGELGHINTDKNCSLYGQSSTVEPCRQPLNQFLLPDNIHEDEMALKTTLVPTLVQEEIAKTECDENEEMKFLDYSKTHWKKLLLKSYLKFNERNLSQNKMSKKRKP